MNTTADPLKKGKDWFRQKKWTPFPFQLNAWQSYLDGYHGLVNAPTGSGKTYALLIAVLLEYLQNLGDSKPKKDNGLQVIWITPIRALGKEIEMSARRAVEGMGVPWRVAVRSGDTSSKERARQKDKPPEFLITTPESLHLLMSQKGYAAYFKNLRSVIVDEWHELMGSKRGVQTELALSKLKTISNRLKVWGISATIGNMDQSVQVLLGSDYSKKKVKIIRADIKKEIEIQSVFLF